MWDSRQVGGAALVHLMQTHPKMLVNGTVVQNPFYKRPEEVLAALGRGSTE